MADEEMEREMELEKEMQRHLKEKEKEKKEKDKDTTEKKNAFGMLMMSKGKAKEEEEEKPVNEKEKKKNDNDSDIENDGEEDAEDGADDDEEEKKKRVRKYRSEDEEGADEADMDYNEDDGEEDGKDKKKAKAKAKGKGKDLREVTESSKRSKGDKREMMEVDFPTSAFFQRREKSEKQEKEDRDRMPWTEKYRPSKMEDIMGHKEILEVIDRFISKGSLPHMLLHGPAGTGKTSLILAIARRLYGEHHFNAMILELNASDDRGIDVVRNEIKEFASTRTIFSSAPMMNQANGNGNTATAHSSSQAAQPFFPFKLIILDEADAMTNPAQAALRRIIEKYTKNVRFCLIANYVSKIIPALQSRCTRFRFAPLPLNLVEERLNYVVQQEKLTLSQNGLAALHRLAKGDMRKAMNILQATAAANDNEITEDAIYLTTGNPLPSDIERMINWLLNEDYNVAFGRVYKLKSEKGLALIDIISNLNEFVDLLMIPIPVKVYLAECLSQIETDLATGSSEKLQLGSLVGAFQIARDSTIALSNQED